MISIAAAVPHTRRTSDHRLREHVVRAGARSLGHVLSILLSWRPHRVCLLRAPVNRGSASKFEGP
jgi:hypothetical protein